MSKFRAIAKYGLQAIVLALVLTASAALAGQNLSIASGKAGGTWYPMGGAIAEAVQNSIDGVNMSVMQGTGDANIIGVNNAMYTLGICFSFATADAVEGKAPFNKPFENIAGLAALYSSPLQIVVRADSDIKTIEDLKGRRIAPGLKGTSGEALVRKILKVHNMSYADMDKVEHVAYADAAMLMKDGHLDAFMPFTTVPAPVIQDIAVSIGGVRLLNLADDKFDALKKINAGYAKYVIKGGSYKGQDADVLCVGSNNVVIVQKKMPEDLVYKMTKALVDKKDKLSKVHKVMTSWDPAYACQDIGVPLHPGAAKLYKEIGALK